MYNEAEGDFFLTARFIPATLKVLLPHTHCSVFRVETSGNLGSSMSFFPTQFAPKGPGPSWIYVINSGGVKRWARENKVELIGKTTVCFVLTGIGFFHEKTHTKGKKMYTLVKLKCLMASIFLRAFRPTYGWQWARAARVIPFGISTRNISEVLLCARHCSDSEAIKPRV